VGVNGFRTHDLNNQFSGRRSALGIDSQFELGGFELWSEALRGTFDPSGAPRFRSSGGYAQASYYVLPEKLQLVGRYEAFGSSHESTFGLNYYFRQHDVKLQLDVMRGPDVQRKLIARLQTGF
jgi:hypothetical protein